MPLPPRRCLRSILYSPYIMLIPGCVKCVACRAPLLTKRVWTYRISTCFADEGKADKGNMSSLVFDRIDEACKDARYLVIRPGCAIGGISNSACARVRWHQHVGSLLRSLPLIVRHFIHSSHSLPTPLQFNAVFTHSHNLNAGLVIFNHSTQGKSSFS